jgi:hypothetical protein
MRRRRPVAPDQSTSNHWCPRPEILRMPLLTPKPRRFAHTLLTRPMSTRRIISKRLRIGLSASLDRHRSTVCSQLNPSQPAVRATRASCDRAGLPPRASSGSGGLASATPKSDHQSQKFQL